MDFLKMTVGQIASLPAFADFEHLVAEENPKLAPRINDLSIETMCRRMPVWDAVSLTEGVEYLWKNASESKVLYDIYTQEEKTDAVSQTGIVAFPVPGKKKAPYVILCPGGSYQHCCKIQEGFPVSKKLNEIGIAAFVLQYRTGENFTFEGAMDDLAHAIRFIRAHADQFDLAMDDYAVMGFSAGGHVAGLWGTEYWGYAAHDCIRPSAIILGYPAVTLRGIQQKLGTELPVKDLPEEAVSASTVYKNINGEYPRTYIWAFDEDNVVSPIEHGKKLAVCLQEQNVPVKYEWFPGVHHGVGLGEHTVARGWLQRAMDFWRREA